MIENPNAEPPQQPAAEEPALMVFFDLQSQVISRVAMNNSTIRSPHLAKAILLMAADAVDRQIKLAEVQMMQQQAQQQAQAQALAAKLARNGR